jgi:hypothetical protein
VRIIAIDQNYRNRPEGKRSPSLPSFPGCPCPRGRRDSVVCRACRAPRREAGGRLPVGSRRPAPDGRCCHRSPERTRTDGVVPKKPRALKELYFYVQTVEVGFDSVRTDVGFRGRTPTDGSLRSFLEDPRVQQQMAAQDFNMPECPRPTEPPKVWSMTVTPSKLPAVEPDRHRACRNRLVGVCRGPFRADRPTRAPARPKSAASSPYKALSKMHDVTTKRCAKAGSCENGGPDVVVLAGN